MTETSGATALDLGTLSTDTADLNILKPGTSEPTGWVITFGGPGHPRTIAINDQLARKSLDEARRIKQAQANGRKYKADEVQPEESRREFVQGLVGRMVTWTPIDIGAGPIAFSDAAAVDLLLNPKMGFAVAQISDFLIDDRSFTKRSGKD